MIERLSKPSKHYKIGLEDFRNIAKRRQYLDAYDDVLERTDTEHAPWHVVASDEKMHARLKGLQIIADRLGEGVRIEAQELDPRILEAAYETWGWRPEKSGTGKK
jgi:polyphosphate kinase 2 (PPK2 family)